MNAGIRLLVAGACAWALAWIATGVAAAPARALAIEFWAAAAILLVLAVVVAARARGVGGGGPAPDTARRGGRDGGVARRSPPLDRIGRHLPALTVLAAVLALIATVTAANAAARAASPLAEAAAEHSRVDVVVTATSAARTAFSWGGDSDESPGSSRRRLDARLVAVDGVPAAGVAVVVTAELPDDGSVFLGARIAVTVQVEQLEPGESAAYELTGTELAVVEPPPAWLAWAAPLRAGFADAAAGLGGDAGALVPGLAIGDTSLVGDELDAAMKASSLSHLTAVSGANCVLVTAGFLVLGTALRMRRGARLVLAAGALAGFVVLVTPEASVVRAAAMALVVLVGLGSGRGAGGTAALGVAILVLLAGDPWLSRSYGFALSALATAGLLLLAAPLAKRLSAWLPEPLALGLAVPLAAQLACQPVLVLLDPAIAGLGVVANLLAGPAAPIGTVVGMFACLLLPWLPGPATWLLHLATLPAGWIAGVAHAVSAMPVNRVPWVPGVLGAVLLAAGSAAALALLFGGGGAERPAASPRPAARRGVGVHDAAEPRPLAAGRILAFVVLVGTLVVPLAALVGGPALARAGRPAGWELAQCDVGQGDAVLLRSAGRTALIDTGPDPAALDACLRLLGVERVDLLVLTHWDADHVGGASAAAPRVDTALIGPLDGERSDRALEPLRAAGAEVVPASAGLHGRLGGLDWLVRWPADAAAAPGNAASVVLEVAGDGWHGLFLGDLGEDAQRALARSAPIGPVDVVKVAHHGSADQSADLYASLGATVGLIGVGAENGYGHPTRSLLDALAANGTEPLRSDRLGTLTLTRDGDDWTLWSERGG